MESLGVRIGLMPEGVLFTYLDGGEGLLAGGLVASSVEDLWARYKEPFWVWGQDLIRLPMRVTGEVALTAFIGLDGLILRALYRYQSAAGPSLDRWASEGWILISGSGQHGTGGTPSEALEMLLGRLTNDWAQETRDLMTCRGLGWEARRHE
jgi:hypothetical protein